MTMTASRCRNGHVRSLSQSLSNQMVAPDFARPVTKTPNRSSGTADASSTAAAARRFCCSMACTLVAKSFVPVHHTPCAHSASGTCCSSSRLRCLETSDLSAWGWIRPVPGLRGLQLGAVPARPRPEAFIQAIDTPSQSLGFLGQSPMPTSQ